LNIGKVLFDKDWKFNVGGFQGAEQKNLNDSSWRNVNLPHDWSIEDIKGTESPFDRKAIDQVSTGFTTDGTGWYRKTFFVPASSQGKKVFIQFEGVYMNSDVYLMGNTSGITRMVILVLNTISPDLLIMGLLI
jgi:beta-galactosidase